MLIFKTVNAMSTPVLTALSLHHVIEFGKDKIAVFHVVVNAFFHLASALGKFVILSILHQLLHFQQTTVAQTLVKALS